MEALGERAWPSFESQWLGTIRRDEGAVAAEEVGGFVTLLHAGMMDGWMNRYQVAVDGWMERKAFAFLNHTY